MENASAHDGKREKREKEIQQKKLIENCVHFPNSCAYNFPICKSMRKLILFSPCKREAEISAKKRQETTIEQVSAFRNNECKNDLKIREHKNVEPLAFGRLMPTFSFQFDRNEKSTNEKMVRLMQANQQSNIKPCS